MKPVLVALVALPLLTRQGDELALFTTWLEREHPGYHADEGPALFTNPTVAIPALRRIPALG
jgi:hypothetical protein